MPAPDSLTLIVRHCGERTTEACVARLGTIFPGVPVHRVTGRPFRETLRRSLELGLAEGRRWTLCIDADVIALPALTELIDEAERLPEDVFEAQALVLDKLIPVRRPAGNHLYRTARLAEALARIPGEGSLRPESDMILAMGARGHRAHQSRRLVGLHDFEQGHEDLYHKAYLHGHKHRFIAADLRAFWRLLAPSDDDYRIALAALEDSREDATLPEVGRDAAADRARAALARLALPPKPPLAALTDDAVDALRLAGEPPAGEAQRLAAGMQRKIDGYVFPPPGRDRPVIVFVGHDAGRTGAPVSLLNLVRWFARHAPFDIEVVLRGGGALLDEYRRLAPVHVWSDPFAGRWDPRRLAGRVLHRVGLGDAALMPAHQAAIVRHLAGRKVAAIVANTGLSGELLGTLKPALGAPVVTRIPELEAFMRRNNANRSAERALRFSERIIAVSQAVKDNLVRRHGVPESAITVVHGSCATARQPRGSGGLRARLGLPEGTFLAGGCGTMDWRKGIDLFIQVARRVSRRADGAGIAFCWIGGPVSWQSGIELRYEVELLGLQDRLFLLGEVADPAPLLADLDVFLLPSREDPFPLVMLEAARQGVPTVCFEGSGGATEFVDAETGVTLEMLDVGGMADAVCALKADPGRRASLGEAAYRRSLRHAPEHAAEAILGVVQGVARKG